MKKECFKFKKDKEAGRVKTPRNGGQRHIRMIEDDMREMVLEEADIPSVNMMTDCQEWVGEYFDEIADEVRQRPVSALGPSFVQPAASAQGRMACRQ